METTTIAPVQLTPSAIEEIKRLMAVEGFDINQRLRLGVKGGGCSGMTYVLGFDVTTEKDEHFEIAGIPWNIFNGNGGRLAGRIKFTWFYF